MTASAAPSQAPITQLDRLALDQQAVRWLLDSDEPGLRMQVRRDLLDEEATDDEARVLDGSRVRALLAGQQPDGGFGGHPYAKWSGAHWRLVSLVEIGIPRGEQRALAAAETVLDWLTGRGHRSAIKTINGRTCRCASQEGNALAVCTRLGMAGDERVALLAESLIGWQWPDGGWNCDKTPRVTHSSFNESLPPAWGLAEYGRATGSKAAIAAAKSASEFFLAHSIYKSHRTGEVGDKIWVQPVYPHYWHYDMLYGLDRLRRVGVLPDPRATDAIALLRSKQQADGTWRNERAAYWRGTGNLYRDPAAWERSGPSRMLTLYALRVLRAAGG